MAKLTPDQILDVYLLNTGDVGVGVYDFGGADSFEIPNAATVTVNADGELAIDTTVADWSHGIMKYYSGEELGVVAMPIAQFTSPTNGYVVAYNATNDEFELVDNTASHTHTLVNITDVTASAAEVNILDLSATALTTGWVYAADGASSASWRQLLGSELSNDSGWTSNAGTVTSVTGGTGIDSSGGTTPDISLNLNELGNETTIDAGDFIAMVDITDSGSQKITFANFEGALDLANLTGTLAMSQTALIAGTSLTLSTNTLNVDDDFLLNDGDVGTGVYDFGGADSFEIPNSATPTVNADGEIAIDTTVTDFSHGILKYYSGEEMAVVAMPIAQLTSPTDGYHVAYNATNDEFELVEGGAGTVTDVTGGTGIASTGGATPDISLAVNELGVTTMVTGDWIVFDDGGSSSKALISAIPLSIFNNDSGWTSNAGTVTSVTGGTGIDSSGGTTPDISLNLNELGNETSIESGDFIAMVDITDSGSQKITFANFEGALTHDNLTGVSANEHIDHTSVTITAGSGLSYSSGGTDISASATIDLDINSLTTETGIAAGDFVPFWDITVTATNKKLTFANFEAALTLTESQISDIGTHTHTLSGGATDVTATAAELNILDLSATALTTGWVYAADGASAASWRQLLGSEISNDSSWTSNAGTVTDSNGANNRIAVWTGATEIEGSASFTWDDSDLIMYEAVNDGNPSINLGSSSAEDLIIQTVYASGTQLLDYVLFQTTEASATANRGLYRFNVDGTNILDIDDGGIDLDTGMAISFNGGADALTATALGTAVQVAVGSLNSGTSASSSTFWRGDGIWATPAGSGDMVLADAQTVTGAKTFDTGTLLLNDTDSVFDLELASTSTITTANKTLTFDVNDGNRTLTITGDGAIEGTNTGDETLSSINALAITTVGTIDTGTWNGSVIASAYLDSDTAHLSVAQTFTGAKTFDTGTLLLNDTDSAFELALASTSTITTSNKTLTFDVNDANRTLTITADGSIEGINTGDEDITSINALAITTVGTIDTGTWNGDVIGVAYGGSGLSTIAAGSVWAANALDTISAVTSTSGTKVLTNTTGTITWETAAGGGDVSKVGTPVDNQIGVWTGDGTIEGDAGFTFDRSDFIIYEAVNDGNPSINLGSSSAEDFMIQTVYTSGAQLLDYVLFQTTEASATANRGLYRFNVDGTNILDIDDGGIDLDSGMAISFNGGADALTATALGTAVQVGTGSLNSGTGASSSTFWRGDGTWATPSGSGDVSKVGTPADNQIAVWTGDGTLGKDDDQNANSTFEFNGTDITYYEAANDGNPELRIGATDAEELHIQTVYDGAAQTLDYVLFQTDVASATANKGLFRFNVDGANILDIDDGGIDLDTGLAISINGTDVLNATTLGSGVTTSSLTTVGTIGTGTWQGDVIASAYLDADTMHLGVAQTVTANKIFNNGTLKLDDSDSAFNLTLQSTSTITTADKSLTFDVNDGNRVLTIGADTTLSGGTHSGTNTGDEDITSINALAITTVGTIDTGVWNGTRLTYAYIPQSTAGYSIPGKATTGAGDFADMASAANSILLRNGSGNLGFSTIGSLTTVVAAAGDFVIITDATDSNNLKKVDVSDFLDGGEVTTWTQDHSAGGFDLTNAGNIYLTADETHLLDFERGTAQVDDYTIGEIRFRHDDGEGAPVVQNYARITGVMESDAIGSEDGSLQFFVSEAGTHDVLFMALNDASGGDIDLLKPVNFNSQNVTNMGTLNTHTIPGGTDTFTLGTGTANQVAYWSGTNTITGDADLTFDGTTMTGGANLVVDFGAATSFELPNSATPTVNADGEIAIDTTITDFSMGLIKYFSGEEMAVVAMPIAQLTTPTDGHVVSYNATNDEFELVAAAGGGDVTKVGTPVNNQIGVWTGDGTIEGDADLTWDETDVIIRRAVNDGNPSIRLGKDDLEEAIIRASYATGTQDLEFLIIETQTASATADRGTIRLRVDEATIADFTDGGLSLTSGLDYEINGTSVLNATTLGSGVTGSSLTSVGTISTGVWEGTDVGVAHGGTGLSTFGGTNTILYTTAADTLTSSSNFTWNSSDLVMYEAVNDGNPSINLGATTTETLVIQSVYDGAAQTLDRVDFITKAASATADKGLFRFSVDEVAILDIDDSGINLSAGLTYRVNGTQLPNGTGTTNQVAYWSGTNTLTGDADLTFDGTTLTGGANLVVDFGASSSFELPNSATPTVNADGEIAIDTTVTDFSHGILKYYSGEEMAVVAMPIAQLTTPTDNHVVTYNATNDEFELQPAAGGGDVTKVGTPVNNQIGVWTGDGTIEGDADLTWDETDIIIRRAVNDGNPSIRLGAADLEEAIIQTVYDTGAQTLDYVLFQSQAASATANKGLFRFSVDEATILDIDDSGINLSAGLTYRVNGTQLPDGTGTANQIAYWSGTNTITGDADLTFDGTTLTGGANLVTDFGASSSFEIPNSATPTVNADGEIAVDTDMGVDWSHGVLKYYSSEEMGVVAMPIAQFTSPTDNYVVTYNSTNNEFELQPGGGGSSTAGSANVIQASDGASGHTALEDHTAAGIISRQDGIANTILSALHLERNSTVTATSGIGVSLEFGVEDGGGNIENGEIQYVLTTVTDTAEVGEFRFLVNDAGAPAQIAEINNAALAMTAGKQVQVTASATTAGLNIAPVAGDPSGLSDGDIWVNATTDKLRVRLNGVTETVMNNVIDDTTPVLSGFLATAGNPIQYQDTLAWVDTVSNPLLGILSEASAINYLSISNGAAGNGPLITVDLGSGEANVDLRLGAKGTGNVFLDPGFDLELGGNDILFGDTSASLILDSQLNEYLAFTRIADSTDYVRIHNGTTAASSQPMITVDGDTTDMGLRIQGKGIGPVLLGDAELQWPDTDGSTGFVLRTDGSTGLSWASVDSLVSAASESTAGIMETATVAEVDTGTDNARAVSPDSLAGSYAGTKSVAMHVIAPGDTLATGDAQGQITIPLALDGMNLVNVDCRVDTVSSSGTPTFAFRRDRGGSVVEMLSTDVTIDANENHSKDAATQPVINATNDDVNEGDVIYFDCDAIGTGTLGWEVILEFRQP